MDQKAVDKYIKELSGSKLSYPHGKQLAVYDYKDLPFAMIENKKVPLRISLRCEIRLAKLLNEKYDEVMPGHKLHKNKWITVVSTGQLNEDELKDLIRHSYLLVKYEGSGSRGF
jgi:predicted DNA-binding protein (MmcQ/YjbR family)